MTKALMDTLGSGYAYHMPSSGFLVRVKNVLSQFCDLFGEFNKYIVPSYYHDRCERSVNMRLYSMHKRELMMVFLAFFTCFGLGILIGLSGPPITSTWETTTNRILSNVTLSRRKNVLATGPFVLKTPQLTTYAQQLWLIAKMTTSNNDDEKYDKSFQINVNIKAITAQHKPLRVLQDSNRNRTRYLSCERNNCEEFMILHLGFLDYVNYLIIVRLYGLESFHQKYNIRSITFFFKTYNPEFTQIEIWFRFIFLLFTFIVICWYAHTLRRYPTCDWSIEQKWISILLPLLLFYDNPFFPMMFLTTSWLPGMLDAILQVTFLCSLLMFWLCIYHGLRQNERNFSCFYFPKIIIVLPIWLSAIILATWEKCNESRDPTYSHFVDVTNYNGFKIFFYISGCMYLLYLSILILRAYTELRLMPFFVEHCKKKWRSLRDMKRRANKMNLFASGSAAPTQRSKWKHDEAMAFLDDCQSYRSTIGNILQPAATEVQLQPSSAISPLMVPASPLPFRRLPTQTHSSSPLPYQPPSPLPYQPPSPLPYQPPSPLPYQPPSSSQSPSIFLLPSQSPSQFPLLSPSPLNSPEPSPMPTTDWQRRKVRRQEKENDDFQKFLSEASGTISGISSNLATSNVRAGSVAHFNFAALAEELEQADMPPLLVRATIEKCRRIVHDDIDDFHKKKP